VRADGKLFENIVEDRIAAHIRERSRSVERGFEGEKRGLGGGGRHEAFAACS
jgi:hypothetical protein